MKLNRQLLRASWRSWYANDMRVVGPGWLQWVWTVVFAMAVAAGFTVLGFALFASGGGAWRNLSGWAYWYGINLTVSLTIAVVIHGLFEVTAALIGRERIRGFSMPQRAVYFGGVPLLGVAVGWPLGAWFVSDSARVWWVRFDDPNALVGSLLLSMLICVLFYLHFDAKNKQNEAERRATEAQLRLLQAQIEPHFLFNTLANVQALMDADPPRARGMLEAFVQYLRASFGTMRGDTHPAGSELDMVDAYLRLLQTRMDDRLRFAIDADADARAVPLPPLLLQPLVENAVVHGLEPKVEGGVVRVRAHLEGNALVMEVSDDGLGLDAPRRRAGRAGTGQALENIRQRLAARYGDEASLQLQALPQGTRAILRLPVAAG